MTTTCPDCDRSVLYVKNPSGALVALDPREVQARYILVDHGKGYAPTARLTQTYREHRDACVGRARASA